MHHVLNLNASCNSCSGDCFAALVILPDDKESYLASIVLKYYFQGLFYKESAKAIP